MQQMTCLHCGGARGAASPRLAPRAATCEVSALPRACAPLPPPPPCRAAPHARRAHARRIALPPRAIPPEAVTLASTAADSASALAAAAAAATSPAAYEPPPVEPWQLWAGFVAGLAPFIIAAYEFGKRILIQRQCALCAGSGLISRTPGGPRRKCTSCGGFLPWQSWQLFLQSSPGNGGPLLQPRGQRSVLYDVEAATRASQDDAAVAQLLQQQEAPAEQAEQ